MVDIERCFEGAIPAVMATASADGVPNVIYVSRAHRVDDERIALSNQFLSKTSRNIAANPRASLLLIDPVTHDEFRMSIVYERTERRGHVFERLRADVDALAALTGMQDVFRLRAADIFRVVDIEQIPPNSSGLRPSDVPPTRRRIPELAGLAELSRRLARCGGLDATLDTALNGLDELLGYAHVHLLLLDETGHMLYTIASRGFDTDALGSEVEIGHGLIGLAAARCQTMRVGNLRQNAKYSRAVRAGFEAGGDAVLGTRFEVPRLADAESSVVAPMQASGQLIGVIVVESTAAVAFGPVDDDLLGIAGVVLGGAVERARAADGDTDGAPAHTGAAVADERELPRGGTSSIATTTSATATTTNAATTNAATTNATAAATTVVRYFEVDGSTFVDGEYLIRGVAGRILWALLGEHLTTGRVDFTNKELRLDPTLDLPGFKDNLESRLILLKRRLDERRVPMQIEKSGRGRFRLHVDTALQLEPVSPVSIRG
jgi:predicted pyridoxine 5'-phosphate oxidase superfamily flavin-nucleotide-binding protein